MPICVVAALPMELVKEKRPSGGEKFPWLREEEGVFWAVTGVGQKNVRRFYHYLDEKKVRCTRIILIGFAGALDEKVARGRVVCYESLIRATGERCLLKVLPGYQHVVGLEVLKWSGPCEKAEWKRRFPAAEVVDMESATHAEECTKRGWELTVLRIVSDGAKERLPFVRYIVGEWKDVPWKRMWQHPWHFIHGVWFSRRLWRYTNRLGYEVGKILEYFSL